MKCRSLSLFFAAGIPMFVDLTDGNIRLGVDTPAIDTAIDVGVPVDLDDNPRPAGPDHDSG